MGKRIPSALAAVVCLLFAACTADTGGPAGRSGTDDALDGDEPSLPLPGQEGADPDGQGADPDGQGADPDEEATDPDEVDPGDIGTEDCTDNLDDNGDGLVDCDDPLCGCSPENCGGGTDDDGDGLIDCLDPDCGCSAEDCGDFVDNDRDGMVDCSDSDCNCRPEPVCEVPGMLYTSVNPAACDCGGGCPEQSQTSFSLAERSLVRLLSTYVGTNGMPGNTFGYTVSQGDAAVRSGTMTLSACTAGMEWCFFADEVDEVFEAGSYTLAVDWPRICANPESGYQGFVQVQGCADP